MSKRKRMTGKAEEMRQIAQVLRQNNIPEAAVRAALLGMCGVGVVLRDNGPGFEPESLRRRILGVEE